MGSVHSVPMTKLDANCHSAELVKKPLFDVLRPNPFSPPDYPATMLEALPHRP